MVVVQRVLVRWTKRGRDAAGATRRGAIPAAYALPPFPGGPMVIHDVVADEAADYVPVHDLRVSQVPARALGLGFDLADGTLKVTRMPVSAAYPMSRRRDRLFQLQTGQQARYRANFRFSGTSSDWYYEQWTINIAHRPREADMFLNPFDADLDERVSLYGRGR